MPRAVIASGRAGSDAFPQSARDAAANVAAHSFDHTVTIERDTATGTDSWGNPVAPTWTPYLVDVACLAYFKSRGEGGREVTDAAKTAGVEERHVLLPLGTDVTIADRLTAITCDDETIFTGPMDIEVVYRRASYIELQVKRVE